ncbi:MAG: hypothetical protein ACXVZR_13400 [Terriglobales bacterium]
MKCFEVEVSIFKIPQQLRNTAHGQLKHSPFPRAETFPVVAVPMKGMEGGCNALHQERLARFLLGATKSR